jgi:hypothetical protein
LEDKKFFKNSGGGGVVLLLWPINLSPLALSAKNDEIQRPSTRKI